MIDVRKWGATEWRAVAVVLACALAGLLIGWSVAKWRTSVERDAYAQGVADGWRGCIEENNLYYRY